VTSGKLITAVYALYVYVYIIRICCFAELVGFTL